ncbi:hypothetical protein MFIFM68171_01009 [Madurella fahalii]|uniref:BTB domain-containing protein n=1 Tax=Madurella fahalii TaxID=1157608 RepID=A0ABQ0FZE8_9PEZI
MSEPQNNMTLERARDFLRRAVLMDMANLAYVPGAWDVLIICGYRAWRCHRELLTRRCSFFARYLPPADAEVEARGELVSFQLPAEAAPRIESLVDAIYNDNPNLRLDGHYARNGGGPVIAEQGDDGIVVEIAESRQHPPLQPLQRPRRRDFDVDEDLFLRHPQSHRFLF